MYPTTVNEVKKKIDTLQSQINHLQAEVFPTEAPQFDERDIELFPRVARGGIGILQKTDQDKTAKIRSRLAHLRVFYSLNKDGGLLSSSAPMLSSNSNLTTTLYVASDEAKRFFKSNLYINQINQKKISTFSGYVYRLDRLLDFYEDNSWELNPSDADKILHDSAESFIRRINLLEERLQKYSYDKLTTLRFYTALANGNFDAIHLLAEAIRTNHNQQDLNKAFEDLIPKPTK